MFLSYVYCITRDVDSLPSCRAGPRRAPAWYRASTALVAPHRECIVQMTVRYFSSSSCDLQLEELHRRLLPLLLQLQHRSHAATPATRNLLHPPIDLTCIDLHPRSQNQASGALSWKTPRWLCRREPRGPHNASRASSGREETIGTLKTVQMQCQHERTIDLRATVNAMALLTYVRSASPPATRVS